MSESEPTVIGRDPKRCNYVLSAPGVSRMHAEVSGRGDAYFIEDLGSSNGVFVNGIKIKPGKPQELHLGDVIQVAEDQFVFDSSSPPHGIETETSSDHSTNCSTLCEAPVEWQIPYSEQDVEELPTFVRSVVHDLQAPLRTILNNCHEVTTHAQLNAEYKQLLRDSVYAASGMRQILDNLVEFAVAGNECEPPCAVMMDWAFEDACKNLKADIEARGAKVTSGPLPTVVGYPVQLMRVLQNLISNAIRYNDSAVPRVHVRAEKKGEGWLFEVTDNGIGIDPEQRPRIFRMFERLDRKRPGSGIGLAICRRIVERHGGEIWVTSDSDGGGSRFCFTIGADSWPVRATEDDEKNDQEEVDRQLS